MTASDPSADTAAAFRSEARNLIADLREHAAVVRQPGYGTTKDLVKRAAELASAVSQRWLTREARAWFLIEAAQQARIEAQAASAVGPARAQFYESLAMALTELADVEQA